MESVIVTLVIDQLQYDIDVPCDVSTGTLIGHIEETLTDYTSKVSFGKGSRYIYSERLKRKLRLDETFDEAGIWNGDFIVLKTGI